MKRKLILWFVLFMAGLLIGFVPQYFEVRRLERETSAANQHLASCRFDGRLCDARELLARSYLEANRKNYQIDRTVRKGKLRSGSVQKSDIGIKPACLP